MSEVSQIFEHLIQKYEFPTKDKYANEISLNYIPDLKDSLSNENTSLEEEPLPNLDISQDEECDNRKCVRNNNALSLFLDEKDKQTNILALKLWGYISFLFTSIVNILYKFF